MTQVAMVRTASTWRIILQMLPGAVTLVSADCAFNTFTSILASNANASVNFAVAVPENGTFSAGGGVGATSATQLPALCAVGINVKSSSNSSYNFGLFLPDTTWNERFMVGGNGGFSGGIQWSGMGMMAQYGFATMSTDTGHNSSGTDSSWALNHESVVDWGYRAMHGSIVLSKEIINAYYSDTDGITYSYYASCSTGGRQGLKEVQLHPDSFDGVSVGAPAWWAPHLSASTLWLGLLNYPEGAPNYIESSLFPTIVAEMKKQCDPQDGLVDDIVSDPFGCNFDFDTLLCSGHNSTSCLTPTQLETLYKSYTNWVDTNQTFVFPGIALGADPSFLLGSNISSLGYGYYQYFVFNDPNWDYLDFTYKDVIIADALNPGDANANDFDLSPFYNLGGKLLHYHGSADPLIPTGSSIYFRKKVQQALQPEGTDLNDFYRFFLIPDMGHCSGSVTGPWYIAGGSQSVTGATHSVPGYEDPKHDIILAMMNWVENKTAPNSIIATKFVNDTVSLGVQSQRPLCLYPEQAKYVSGDPNVPESWECQSLY
ncbi:feruloyl esterase B precursor [Xylariaceae sp. FL0255]|nr:feruloyl esterase B precursor [Xylariaceae sp. FL0255]